MPQTNNTFGNTAPTKGLRLACYCLLLLLLTAPTLWAQRTNVIDNKGTLKSIGNTVTTAATAPTSPSPIQGDIWFDTTLTGSERTKVWDGTAWKEISPDYIELWVNNTNGGSYATNDLVAYNGHIYRNISGTNADTTPNSDTTNWVSIDTNTHLGYKTVHNGASALAITHADHNLVDLHLEGAGDLSIAKADVTGATTLFITNTTANDRSLSFTDFAGAYLRNGGTETNLITPGLTLKANTRYLVHITNNAGNFYFNATEAGGGIDEGTATANTLYWNGTDWVESTALQNDGTDVRITGALKDSSGDAGNSGEILSSTASGTNWISGQDGIENWALANAYAANDVVIHNNKIYQANGAITASTPFAIGSSGATWKEISKSANSITNELSFEDTAGTYFYVSLLVDNAWKVIKYKLDDVNDEETATVSNNSGQTTQPNTLALCETLTYN